MVGKINYLQYVKCLILLVVQSLTGKLDIQVLYGKYYVCNKMFLLYMQVTDRLLPDVASLLSPAGVFYLVVLPDNRPGYSVNLALKVILNACVFVLTPSILCYYGSLRTR